jgi:hypothetical protein
MYSTRGAGRRSLARMLPRQYSGQAAEGCTRDVCFGFDVEMMACTSATTAGAFPRPAAFHHRWPLVSRHIGTICPVAPRIRLHISRFRQLYIGRIVLHAGCPGARAPGAIRILASTVSISTLDFRNRPQLSLDLVSLAGRFLSGLQPDSPVCVVFAGWASCTRNAGGVQLKEVT